jgi:hypothetical protein
VDPRKKIIIPCMYACMKKPSPGHADDEDNNTTAEELKQAITQENEMGDAVRTRE